MLVLLVIPGCIPVRITHKYYPISDFCFDPRLQCYVSLQQTPMLQYMQHNDLDNDIILYICASM
jgi:hypothetical protein